MFININLRGTVFTTDDENFKTFPDSRLANLSFTDSNYDFDKDEYYFDRNPILFNFILDLYTNGDLHIPKNICSTIIKRELQFWNLSYGTFGKCCLRTVYADEEDLRIYGEYEKMVKQHSLEEVMNVTAVSPTTSNDKTRTIKPLREKILYMLMYPYSSISAKIYFGVIVTSVLLSIAVFAMETLETFRVPRLYGESFHINITNPKLLMYASTRPHSAVLVLDMLSNTVLVFDYVIIVYASRDRVKVLSNIFRILDIVSLVSVYILNLLDIIEYHTGDTSENELRVLSALIGVVYCFRIIRVLRLLGHTQGMIALYATFIANASVIIFFLAAFMTISFLSAAMIYQTEIWSTENFANFFSCLWWAVVTLSSVGYGDMVPASTAGQVITVLIIVVGLLLIAIPFVLITSNYGNYYSCFENIKRQKKLIDEFNSNNNDRIQCEE